MKKLTPKLTCFIACGLVGGIVFGLIAPEFAVKTKFLSDIFLRMIKMIIAPLLFSTLVVGIAGQGNIKGIGKLGVKSLIYFGTMTTFALLFGFVFGNIFQPGTGLLIEASVSGAEELAKIQGSIPTVSSFVDNFVNMVPSSIIDAMARGDILQIVVFAVFFALALAAIGEKGKPVLGVLGSLSELMFKFTEYVMFFAPLGIFGAIATSIGQNGVEVLGVYAKLIGTLYLALVCFAIIILATLCKICKIPFFKLIKALKEPIILAFSTASSESALPKAMEIMEDFGVSKKTVGFVMPSGYSFNLNGSTLYLPLAVLFIAQMAGIEISLSQQLAIMFTLMLTTKGITGVPRVSLVVLAGTLTAFNIPIAGMAVLIGIDHILDMGRTVVNLVGNCVAPVVIAKWEKDFNHLKMNDFIRAKDEISKEEILPMKPPIKNIFANEKIETPRTLVKR